MGSMRNFMRRAATIATGLLLSMGLSVIAAQPASATWNDPKVNLSGHMDCSGLETPTWSWYETTGGERGWVDLSAWTKVNRAAPGVLKLIEIKTYKVWLTNVSKDGTTITIKTGCKGALTDRVTERVTSFGVQRPTFGRDATRHVCYGFQLLNCIW